MSHEAGKGDNTRKQQDPTSLANEGDDMTVEEAIKSINKAIGVGDRKVTNKVITKPLVYPHREQR